MTAVWITAFIVGFLLVVVWGSDIYSSDGWFILGLLVVVFGLVVLFMDVTSADRAKDQRCIAQGGYMERGRGIELCIDVQAGTIIRLLPEVEK